MNWVPFTSESPSFAASAHRLETGSRERVRAGQPLALEPGLPLADERQRQMRERREVTGRPDRAAARHDRQHSAVEEREQQFDRLHACARVAFRQRVRAQEHRRADDLVGVRVADPARVGAKQPKLQLGGLFLRDGDRDEAAEAGVDAVGVLAAAVRRAFHELAGGAHLLPRLVGELGARSFDRHRPDVVDAQVVARKADRRPLRHDASLGTRPTPPVALRAPGGFRNPLQTPYRPGCHVSVAAPTRLSRRMPASRLLVGQEPQLQHVRSVETRHPEKGAGRSDRGTRRQEAHELRPRDPEPSRGRLPLHRGHDLVQRRSPPVLDVEAHLDTSRLRQTEPERANAGEASVTLAHGLRHLPRGVQITALEIDVEGDQRRAGSDQHAARPLIEPCRAEVRRELAGVQAPLQLGRARRAGRRPAQRPRARSA